MRQYEKRHRTTEYSHLVKLTCDLCGEEAKGGDWQSSVYEVNEVELAVTVRQKEGTSFPEGGHGQEYVIDMCPTCFKDRLVVWLKSQGAEIELKDWDW